ncbi:MAG: HlyD family efflux transporter periplasmic adaptor subunit [Candidatus Eremiobacteraeota bacterium]|nr:HlyD family efflux transporter periplasmic adaptor subunit [Candidatus Eremiobacteraeota bacterium]MCW5867052.1 HlyD family efflux transporter periplasmic adaptor subunit [Candidatus Eremiobacteraeota bacterium]
MWKTWLLLTASFLVGGCQSVPQTNAVEVKTAAVRRGSMGNLVICSGKVQVRRRAAITAPEGGLVTRVEAAEGDRVRSGQPLLYLAVKKREAQVDLQVARLEQARARLAQSRSQLRSSHLQHGHKLSQSKQGLIQAGIAVREAKTEVDAAYADWQRKAQLLKEKSIAANQVEQAELQWKIKQYEWRQAISKEANSRIDSQSTRDAQQDLHSQAQQVAEAEGAVREAEVNLSDARREETETVVRAPIAGLVTSLKVVPGQSVSTESLGQIIDVSDKEVMATLDPAQISRLDEKSPATVHSPLVGEKGAPIRFVDVVAAVEGGTGNTVHARFRFIGTPPPRLVDGLDVQVRIQMPEQKGWLVPRDALGEDQSHRNRLRLYRNRQEVPVPVDVLSLNETHALVAGDLQDGDQVVLAGR